MNKSVKIIILAIAVIVAVGGVMYFYKTIVSPPRKLEFNNQFIPPIETAISDIRDIDKTDYNLDSVYTAVTHRINFQWKEALLTDSERDRLFKSFIEEYVPPYVKNCNKKFTQSIWDENVLNRMQAHINELLALTTSKGAKIVAGNDKTSLDEVNNVINDYYAAKDATKVAKVYQSLEYAKNKKKTADSYKKKYPISNCTSLVEQLNSVPLRLEQAHYAFLKDEVNKLGYKYFSCTEEEYDKLSDKVTKEINEYEENANEVYRKISDTDQLRNKAADYYTNAKSYFKNKNS